MKKFLLAAIFLSIAAPANAQQPVNTSTFQNLPQAGSLTGNEIFPLDQGGTTKKATISQLGTGGTVTAVSCAAGSTGLTCTVTNPSSTPQITITGSVNLANIHSIGGNTILGSPTGGPPVAISIGGCSGAGSALTWTTSSGFGCNTISGGSGSVTSVAMTADGVVFSGISGSPITTSGTFVPQLASIPKNEFLAGPSSGANEAWTARSIVGADLPLPTSGALGGVKAQPGSVNSFVTAVNTDGSVSIAQPNFTSLGGTIASNQLIAATTTSLGGVIVGGGLTITTSGVLTTTGAPGSGTVTEIFAGTGIVTSPALGITTTGTVSLLGATATTLGGIVVGSGLAITATGVLSATNTASGSVTSISTSSPISGGPITTTGTISITGAAGQVLAGSGPAFTATPTLGVAGSTLGTLALAGSTTQTVTIQPQATAGNSTLTLPNTSGTVAVTASSPIVLSATTGNLTCPTCNTSSANVNSVSGDGTLITNSTSTGAVTLTIGNALPASVTGSSLTSLGTIGTLNFTNALGTTVTATTVNAALSGNATTATALQNARTIGGTSFNGTANITVASATAGFTVSGGNLTISANNIVTDTTTGSDFGTSTSQKIGFYGVTPIVQPTGEVGGALTTLGLMASPSALYLTATVGATAGKTGIISPLASQLAFETTGSVALTITSTQSVGIGTTAPAAALDVVGGIDLSGINGLSFPDGDNSSIAVGQLAGASQTSSGGAANVYVGNNAGQFLSSGNSNTAIGQRAMLGATTTKTTGSANTALGTLALSGCIGACNTNTALGYDSGANITTGSGNIDIGYAAAASSATVTNEIVIGTSVTGNGASTTTFQSGHFYIPGLASGALTSDFFCYDTSNGEATYQTSNCTVSLRALKDSIETFDEDVAFHEAMMLTPVTFYMKNEHNLGKEIGLIAEDVEAVDPKLAVYDDKTGKLRSVQYDRIGVLAIAAIQAQQKEIEQLKPSAVPFHRCISWLPLVCGDYP